MKLGIVTYQVAQDWDLPTIIRVCRETGYSGVELRTTHAHGAELACTPDERAGIRSLFAEAGIDLWCLGTTCEYHSPDQAEVQARIAETRDWITLAHDVGACGVKVRPNGLPGEVPEDRTLAQIGVALRECGDCAAPLGVQVMLEVHGRETSDPRRIETIMRQCDHPAVGVTWNCNQSDVTDGSVRDSFTRLAPWLMSAHIHDLYEDYPYCELIALMKQVGFDGYCLIEMPASGEPERLLRYYSLLWQEWTR